MKYVLIGNSAAAIGCVEGIREVDKSGEIVIISDEPHHTYSRPLISYLLLGKTDEQRMKYRGDDFYEKNGVTVMLGETVEKIDAKAKCVTLASGKTVDYDKLLCSTGSRPFVPPAKGLETVKNQFTFMTLDSALALDKALTKDSRVLIVGAGLIGLKCAEGILNKIKSLTVVDLAPKILSSILDDDGAKMVQSHLEQKGIEFILGDCVEEYTENSATLKSGKTVDFDVLVLAVGVRPNTSLISDAGGEVNRGIVTDLTMKTTLDDVYAAGDCTESHDISADCNRILALLPNAYIQGLTAGKNMAGEHIEYDLAIPMNAIGFFGLHMITAGSYVGEEKVKIGCGTYKKMFIENDLLKGYIMIGDIDRAGIYTALIRNKTPLSSINFDLIFERPTLMAFSANERAKVLGGAK